MRGLFTANNKGQHMTQDEIRQQIAAQVDDYLSSGGQIQPVDATHNKDAATRFVMGKAGPRYVDKQLAAERQSTRNKVKRKRV